MTESVAEFLNARATPLTMRHGSDRFCLASCRPQHRAACKTTTYVAIVPSLPGEGAAGRILQRAASHRLAARVLVLCLVCCARPAGAGAEIKVTLDPAARATAVDGRLLVYLSQRMRGEPRQGLNWFQPQPLLGIDVRDWQPGSDRVVDDAADGYPSRLSQLPAGPYRVQALLHQDPDTHDPNRGTNNLYSPVAEWNWNPAEPAELRLILSKMIETSPFRASPRAAELIVPSELLSTFHGREVREYAGVWLPPSYATEPERRYPVVLVIGGFGGSHRQVVTNALTRGDPADGEQEMIRVLLSGDCGWGHHVYADSATNGPRGAALVQELIPALDRAYRTIPEPRARFLTGPSSGGWAALWLQVRYPSVFGGVWSLCPDPVDFHDYQQVDLYADPAGNMFRDETGARRPLARDGRQPVLYYDDFTRLDDVLGRGGQLRSFEAVFSPRDVDGLPRRLYDRFSGQIDRVTVEAWRAYDISEILVRDWPALGPQLAGKLRIASGELDTFYLEGAVRRLADTLRQLGSDAEVEIVPGKNHFNLVDPERVARIRREMSRAFRASQVEP